MKTNLAGFQCTALASGLIATPASPMAPDLESGDINKNGTAEVMVLIPELPFKVCVEICAFNVLINTIATKTTNTLSFTKLFFNIPFRFNLNNDKYIQIVYRI